MSLHSTTFCNFGQNRSFHCFHFKTFTLPSFISLHSVTFSNFSQSRCFHYFHHFRWSLWTFLCTTPLHSAIFSVIFIKIVQHFRHFGHFFFYLWLRRFVPHELSLMLHECYYTQQVFVIFIKIVLFVVFMIFVGVFEPSYALCHCTEQFFLFLFKIVLIIFFGTFGPSHASCYGIALNSFFVILSVLLTTCGYL